ncbi:MAG: metallophosphoesterase [Alistipes indistinctus]
MIPKQYASCAVCGDIHGEFDFLAGKIKRMELSDTLIIVAGDCGIGFDKSEYYQHVYQRIVKTLKKNNCELLLVRGNHDDPEYFERELISFPRMKTLPDYSVVRFRERTVFVCRRRHIDRPSVPHRSNADQRNQWSFIRKLYWERRSSAVQRTSRWRRLKSRGLHIDTVVTHTAPSFCYPTTKRESRCGWTTIPVWAGHRR